MAMGDKRYAGEPFGRLTRASEFASLRRGKRIEAGFGRLQGGARTRGADAAFALRFGMIVPKKLGDAPKRNRIKRRLRAGLRLAQLSGCFEMATKTLEGRTPARTGADIAVIPSASLLTMGFETLLTELCSTAETLMRKLWRHPI